MEVQAVVGRGVDREFWRDVLLAGGFTPIPRWSIDPATGTAEHVAKIPDDLVTTLRRLAAELEITASSVLLAAHAKVLSVLSGEREVATGYAGRQGGQPLLCRLTTEPDSWRSLLLATHQAESELLAHSDFPVDDLRREMGLTEACVESLLDPTGLDATRGYGDLSEDTVLWVGISGDDGQRTLRLRYQTGVLDADSAARIAGYHLTALELIAADPDAEHRL
jgi:non-ribosomal peptide synthetase component F